MTQQTDITVLDHIVAVNLAIHIWSARKKLDPVDLGSAVLPPEDLASLGSKKICDPDALKVFGTLKARAVSLLDRIGVRFLSGWAVPESRIDEVTRELMAIRDEFDQEKEAFLNRYDQAIQDWIAKHPQWSSIIANSIVSESHVRSRTSFCWQVFKVSIPEKPGQDSLHSEIFGLGHTLFGEVAKAATEAWHRCYAGKLEITRKALSPLKTIHDKLMGLVFVEPRVLPIAELLATAFASIPKRGIIKDSTLVMLQGLVSLLRNPEALLEHGQMILEGNKQAQDVLGSFLNNLPTMDVTEFINCGEDEEPMLPMPEDAQHFVPPLAIESHGLW
jgi:hypothetical protein